MSDEKRETKPDEKGEPKPNAIQDLADVNVSEKHTDQVKGGNRILNFPFDTGKPTS